MVITGDRKPILKKNDVINICKIMLRISTKNVDINFHTIILFSNIGIVPDTTPELHYTFIEQALHPGPALALHCVASGSPAPRFTWLLDSLPIEEHSTPQR